MTADDLVIAIMNNMRERQANDGTANALDDNQARIGFADAIADVLLAP